MATIHVATTGKDTNTGKQDAPVRNISRGMTLARAGDTVLVGDGTYTESLKPSMILMKAGVTLKAAHRRKAILRTPSYCYAVVVMANNSTVDGFDIVGEHGHGIWADSSHHLKVTNNRMTGGYESGCGSMKSDFIRIEGNETSCPHLSTWGSGITIYEPEMKALNAGEAEPEFRIIVRNNISHGNFQEGGPFSDGNGIILDDFQHWQNDPKVEYNRGFLVENNLCYDNGGKGIAIHWANNGIVRNNTCVRNNRDNKNGTTWRGELSQQGSHGVRWERNIGIPDKAVNVKNSGIGYYGDSSTSIFSDNVVSDAKINLGGGPEPTSIGNRFNADPKLVDFVPTAPGFETVGWRPSGVVVPPVDPPVPPVDPDPTIAARLSAVEALAASTAEQAAGMAAEYGQRLLMIEEKVATLQAGQADLHARLAVVEDAHDLSGVREELSRLDARLDAISGAARD